MVTNLGVSITHGVGTERPTISSDASRKADVFDALEALEKRIGSAQEKVMALAARLSPVLRASVPSESPEGRPPVSTVQRCPLALDLDDLNGKMGNMVGLVEDLLVRLEL